MGPDPTSAVTDPGALPIQLPSLANTLGVLLIATFIGLLLLGVTLHQAYRYARTFPHDPKWLKILVAFSMFLETASGGLSIHVCYYYLVTNYFRPDRLTLGLWSTNLYPSVAGAAMVASQSFFARRVWLLEPRYRVIVVMSCVFSLTELGIFIAGTCAQFINNTPNDSLLTRLLPISFCLAMAADLMLTASLIHILRRKRTGFKSTDTMIDVLVLYSVNTGLLNGVFDLLTMILAFVLPQSNVWAAFGISGAKLYAITLLAALHSRNTVRVQGSAELQDSEAVFGVSVFPGPRSSQTHSVRYFRKSIAAWHHVHQLTSANAVVDSSSDVIEIKAMSVTLQGNEASVDRRERPSEDGEMRRHS